MACRPSKQLSRTSKWPLSGCAPHLRWLAVVLVLISLQIELNGARDFVCPDREVDFDRQLKRLMDQSELIFTGTVEDIRTLGPDQVVTARIKSVFKGDKVGEDAIVLKIVGGQLATWVRPMPFHWFKRTKDNWCFPFDELKVRDTRIFMVASGSSFASAVTDRITIAPPFLVSAFLLTKLRILATGESHHSIWHFWVCFIFVRGSDLSNYRKMPATTSRSPRLNSKKKDYIRCYFG